MGFAYPVIRVATRDGDRAIAIKTGEDEYYLIDLTDTPRDD
jgi:hypothetical protein